MKTKIIIAAATIILSILGTVSVASAVQLEIPDVPAEISEQNEKGCNGFNDKVKASCPIQTGENPPVSEPGDNGDGGNDDEGSTEWGDGDDCDDDDDGDNGNDCDDDNDNGDDDDDDENSSNSQKWKGGGKVLGISTERDDMEIKVDQNTTNIEQIQKKIDEIDTKIQEHGHEEVTPAGYFWAILVIALFISLYVLRTELKFQKNIHSIRKTQKKHKKRKSEQ